MIGKALFLREYERISVFVELVLFFAVEKGKLLLFNFYVVRIGHLTVPPFLLSYLSY